MKQLTLAFIFLLAAFNSKAHDFYFAYAEVEINELEQRVEATIYATTHDLEKEIREQSGQEIKIYGNESDSTVLSLVQEKVNEGFGFSMGGEKLQFKLEAIEVKLNGTIFLYISSSYKEFQPEIKLRFDLLMDTFQEQQNKLDLKFRGTKATYVFMIQNKEYAIQLIKNDE